MKISMKNAIKLAFILPVLNGCTTTSLAGLTEEQLQQQADNGSGAAQYELAQRLMTSKNYPQAMQRLQQAAQNNGNQAAKPTHRATAARQVADWYQNGLGEARNQAQALYWWQKAAGLGDTDASWHLAEHCRREHKGRLVADCIDNLTRAAKQGHPRAQTALAQWYGEHGENKTRVQWLEKAAKHNDAQAQYELAQHYRQGKGVRKQPGEADILFTRSANQNYTPAIRWLAAHSKGDEALHWYEKAARQGEAAAQLWLALAYLKGDNGLPHNDYSARRWLREAVKNGSPQASYQCSLLQNDKQQRQHYLLQAAERGWHQAQRELAQQYTDNEDYVQARKLWQQLASAGDTQAQLIYGDFLRQGTGGKTDMKAAVRHYRQAAYAGDHQAQYRLAVMYQQGLGVARNRIRAYAWYALSAVTDDPGSMQALNGLEQSLSSQDIARAQSLALHWQQRSEKTTAKPSRSHPVKNSGKSANGSHPSTSQEEL